MNWLMPTFQLPKTGLTVQVKLVDLTDQYVVFDLTFTRQIGSQTFPVNVPSSLVFKVAKNLGFEHAPYSRAVGERGSYRLIMATVNGMPEYGLAERERLAFEVSRAPGGLNLETATIHFGNSIGFRILVNEPELSKAANIVATLLGKLESEMDTVKGDFTKFREVVEGSISKTLT